MRLAVYADFAYRRDTDGQLYAEEAFALFMFGLRQWVDGVTVVGRLDPEPGTWHYPVPDDVGFAPLPHYGSLAESATAARSFVGAARAFWRALDDVDAVWLLGPQPLAHVFAVLARVRGRRVTLGVRQHWPTYVRNRRPGRRGLLVAAWVLEIGFRVLALRAGVVAVGPDLAHRYRHGRRVLAASISLVPEARLLEAPAVAAAPVGAPRVLSVGRLDAEKNPLLLADIAARIGDRARLVICGDGALRGELEARLAELGVTESVEMRGYVAVDGELPELYRTCDVLLHVSWTEGFPQVLVEAFAAGLPVVATAVGGVPELAGDAALLVEPGDADAAADAVLRLLEDRELATQLAEAGRQLVRAHTLEATTRRVAAFIAEA
jgi:glycosyltransferase involved in cell wall biosynthesis